MGADDLEGAGVGSFGAAPVAVARPAAPASLPHDTAKHATRRSEDHCWLARRRFSGSPARRERALPGRLDPHARAARSGVRARHLGAPAHALPPAASSPTRRRRRSSTRWWRMHRTRAAEAEIADYLRAHPNGLRSAEMHFVRGTLLRRRRRQLPSRRARARPGARAPRGAVGARAHAPLAPTAARNSSALARRSPLRRGRGRRLQAHRRRRHARLRHLARLLAARHHLLHRRALRARLRRRSEPCVGGSQCNLATRRVRRRRHRRHLRRRRRLRSARRRLPPRHADLRSGLHASTPASAPATRRATR